MKKKTITLESEKWAKNIEEQTTNDTKVKISSKS